MREILFRGKSEPYGDWVEGFYYKAKFLITDKELCDYITIPHPEKEGRRSDHILVMSETIGQYTGLTDKNGKKIFEGDIVDCWSEGVNAQGTVQQRRDGLWIIYPAWQKHIMWGLCPDEYNHTTVEVIGNIHDNPELIKT